jgi:hypothetical protein
MSSVFYNVAGTDMLFALRDIVDVGISENCGF